MTAARKRLTLAADEPGPLERNPNDGFQLAEPIPIGPATEKVARAILRALLPPPPAPRTPEMEDLILRHVRVMVQYMPPLPRRGFFLLLHLLDWSPLWRFQGLLPITAMPVERASRILHGVATSRFLPIRMIMLAPKALFLSTYFDQDVVHRGMDYEPRGFTRDRIALRARLVAGERAHADDDIHHGHHHAELP